MVIHSMVTRSGTETHCCNEGYTDAEREVLVGQEQTNCGARERQREREGGEGEKSC